MNLNEFTEEEVKNTLLGTIFADGSIGKQRTDGSRNGTNADMEITHTSKNLDYLVFKKSLLERVPGIKCKITEHNKKTEAKTYTLYRLTTNRHPWLTYLRDELYKNRIKLFPKKYVDSLTLLGLFLMYLDDGTLKVRMKEGTSKIREVRITWCLDSFTLGELNYFRQYLENKYGLKSHIYRHSKMQDLNRGFRIWFNSENTNKLLELFDSYYDLVPSMKYKFVKYYSL